MTSMVKAGVTTAYQYDPENRLTKVTQNSVTLADYTYDDFGERVSKKVNSQRTDYFYPFFEKSAQKEDQYVIFDGVRVAKVSGGGAVTYFHQDHLGSHHVTTNSSGAQTLVTNYLPFGEFEGTPPTGTEGPNYTGQHYDAETGLYYYGARYYNPKVGRFLTADWIVQSPFNSQSYNRFSYVANNPVNFVDPSGNAMILSDTDLDQQSFSSFNHYYGQQSFFFPQYDVEGVKTGKFDLIPVNFGGVNYNAQRSIYTEDIKQSGVNRYLDDRGVSLFTAKPFYELHPREMSTFDSFSLGLGFLSSVRAAQVAAVPFESSLIKETAKVTELIPTHGKTMSNRQLNKLIANIKEEGIKESLTVTEYQGQLYILDGHHRTIAARRLGIIDVPVTKVDIPYGAYKTPYDLFSIGE